ncbi:hypothetical protein Tco_0169744 [Tanacetum coccineum]
MENYKNVSQDIRDQLNAEAEAVQIILTGIDNDITHSCYACPECMRNVGKPLKGLPYLQPSYSSLNILPPESTVLPENRGKSQFVTSYASYFMNPETLRLLKMRKNWGSVDMLNKLIGKDDTDELSHDETELEAHYMYMAQLQEVTPDSVDTSGPIFDDEPMHKVQNNNDNYNVFAMENEHPEQPESSNDIYLTEQGDSNIPIDSSDICYDRAQDDQDEPDDLDQERDLLASLIQKLKCEIDDSKNRNKFLESSNKEFVDKLKGEIEDFKTKNKSLESSNNHFKEANNELSKTNQLMFNDIKKFQAELDKYKDVNYASKVEIECAKAKGDLMSYKIDFAKSSNAYTQQINDLNQTILDMKKELCAHQETISIISQAKEAQIKLYKTREARKP